MRYFFHVLALAGALNVFGQRSVNIKALDMQTQIALDVSFRVNDKPREATRNGDGYYVVRINPSDTITISAVAYPIKRIPAPKEDMVVIPLDKSNSDGTGVYSVVDETAMFPGGMVKFYEYVGKNMRYPREAKKDKADGRVFVEFVIDADGSIDRNSIRVLAGIHPACDKEAARIVRECQAWIPGKINGQPVRQLFVLPFVFRY